MNVTFYDPHPGLMGCPRFLSEEARLVAFAVDGMSGDPNLVADKFRKVCPNDVVEVVQDEEMILLTRTWVSGRKDCWRVISFREEKK